MINEVRLKIAEFLGISLIENNYFFLDYWAFVHIFTGFLIMILMSKFLKHLKNIPKFALLFLFIIFWEIFELSSSWVKPESSIDIIYDLIMGMFGGWLSYSFKNKFRVFS